ncbi:MAG TPA: cytochrome P450 [Acidimicrobiia bacterium]|nr:cytochrome P450 [Acidimicrobiia bacterium]
MAELREGYRATSDVAQDLFDLAAPQPKYRALLDAGGVVYPSEGMVLVASRAAAEAALQDPARFSAEGLVDLGNVRPLIPLSVDPPRHVKYRKILDPLFAPKRMDALEDDITTRVNRFIDAFADRGRCHFTDELAVPFPSAVFLGLMGLPWEELDTFLRLKDGILRPGGGRVDAEERARIQSETAQEIYAYFDAVLDERTARPRDDILTHFLTAEIDGERLTREEILDICFLFLIAGLDTVTDTLTCSFAFLAQHPEHRHEIASNPAVIPSAVEELLRWETPVPNVFRVATLDTELAGCLVGNGSVVTVNLGAANIDPAEYPDAFDVRFDREVNRHLAFGAGVHRCLGSHLARRELRVTMREWHRRIPEYELEPGLELEYPLGLRSVENLVLVWER